MYPLFYDALYYPQYHLRVFSTAENFCSWLQSSLSSHRELYSTCSPLFQTTSVVYDGLALCVRVDGIAMTFARSQFESAMYSHLSIFKRFLGASKRLAWFPDSRVETLEVSTPKWLSRLDIDENCSGVKGQTCSQPK
jgi:hypothetical protein